MEIDKLKIISGGVYFRPESPSLCNSEKDDT